MASVRLLCDRQAAVAHRNTAGRAVLIDYWSFTNKSFNPNTTHPITVSQIKACAAAHNIIFQYGDILVFRSGFIDTYNGLSQSERERLASLPSKQSTFVGLEQSEEMLDFLHDSYFAAVVSDTPAFEAWPPKGKGLHTHVLALWGMPIGELWDLEKLAATCREKQQYAFFLSSAPTNLPGMSRFHLWRVCSADTGSQAQLGLARMQWPYSSKEE